MDSADQTLKILIQLGVLGEKDAQAAKQLLDETSAAGKKLGESMGVITVSATEANKILEQSGEKAEISHRGFKKLAHMIGSDIPGATAMMEAGFSASAAPMMGATFLLIGGIEMLRHALAKIAEDKKLAREIDQQMIAMESKHADVVGASRRALEQAEVAEEAFHHNLARNTRNAVDEAEKLAEALLKTASASDSAHADRRKNIADSRIADMERQGVISHEAALKMKEQLDIEYEKNKLIRQMAADKLEERLLIQKYQQKSYAVIGDLDNNEKNAGQKYDEVTQKKSATEAQLKSAQEKKEDAKGVIKKMEEAGITDANLERLRKYTISIGGDPNTDLAGQYEEAMRRNRNHANLGFLDAGKLYSAFGTQGVDNLQKYEGAQASIKMAEMDIKKYDKKSHELDIVVVKAKSDLDNAQQQLQAAKNEVVALKDQITTLQGTNNIKHAGLMQDLGLTEANSALKEDLNIADRMQHGDKSVTKAEEQKLISDASKIAGHQVDLKTAAKVIEHGATNMKSFMEQVKRLAIAMGSFTPQQAADLQRQIDAIVRTMKGGGGKQVS
jgi:hypothetical protein